MCSRSSFRGISSIAFSLFLILAAGACSGGSGAGSPTDPGGGGSTSVLTLSTSWGDVAIVTDGHPFDPGRALASIEHGYAKAREQIGDEVDRYRIDQYRITVMPADWELNGQHLRDRREIRVRAGIENVLEHELQHFFAWELDRFSDCRTYQDHPQGFDLHCSRI